MLITREYNKAIIVFFLLTLFCCNPRFTRLVGEYEFADQLNGKLTVHYGLDLVDKKMLQYIWIAGHKNVVLFVILTINPEQESQKIDEDYLKVVDILDTIKIFPQAG